jgi:transposase-like protein
MKPIDLSKFRALVGMLSAEDLMVVMPDIIRREQVVQSTLVVREAELSVKACPHCDGNHLAKAGHKDGKQRFLCKACKRTFNVRTGTPMARLRMESKHIENAECMIEGLSVRKVARKLKVNSKTAFRWRHRFLLSLKDAQPANLSGVVEADETFFLESFKGQRKNLPRPAKTRGTKAKKRGLSQEQIPVLVARDRSTGATLTAKLQDRSSKQIGECLVPVLSKDVVLCSDGASAYRTIGKKHGIDVKSVPAKGVAGNYHINNVNAYDSRLKGWMFRFQGVATKYLDNYLGWHRMLDKAGSSPSGKLLVAGSLAYH